MLEKCRISGFADEIDQSIEKQITFLKELGISFIEFRSGNGKNIADYTIKEAYQIKELLWKEGIHISAIGSPIGKIAITDDFEEHFNRYKNVVDLAKVLETPYIRMFSFYIPEGEKADKYRDEVMKRISRFVDYARSQHVVLLHENEKGIYGDNASRCEDLFREFYGEHFKCTFDFANFVQCGQNTLEAYEELEDYIEYIHIKDALWNSGEVVPAGEGDGNLKEILSKLNQKGYQGFLSLEPHLAIFSSLKQLEKNEIKQKETDGEAAFRRANAALIKLLEL